MDEFKYGDDVEVRDGDHDKWQQAVFVAYDPGVKSDFKYLVRRSCDNQATAWTRCRHRKPDLKIDDPVLVRNNDRQGWEKRHFSGWSMEGSIMVFDGGRTSFTKLGILPSSIWQEYKIPTKDELK